MGENHEMKDNKDNKTNNNNNNNNTDPNNNKSAKRNTYDDANILSKLYCFYIFPFLYRNFRKDFDLDDIDGCSKNDNCDYLANRLRVHWHKELINKKHNKPVSLLRALFKTFGVIYGVLDCFNFVIYGILRMVMPMLLGRIIYYANLYREELANEDKLEQFKQTFNGTVTELQKMLFRQSDNSPTSMIFENDLTNAQNVILYALLMCLFIFLNFALTMPYYMGEFRLGMQIRVALTKLVYEKALRISNTAIQRITVGRVVNLISNDANRFDTCLTLFNFCYLAPLHAVVAMLFLYYYLGRSSLGTLAIILLYIPLQTVMANILSKFRSLSIQLTDNRLRLMAEIFPAMRVIKMYAWEKPFSLLIHMARKDEISKIRKSMILRSINLAIFFVSDKAMAFICIVLHLLDGGELTAEKVFVSLSLIRQIREGTTYFFPIGISYGVESYISLKRIQNFLLEDEIDEAKNQTKKIINPAISKIVHDVDRSTLKLTKECRISLENVKVNSEIDNSIILDDISFEVVPGQLTVIIGPVGSGKSSVLLSILGELPHNSGEIDVSGSLIYASQEAWIFNGTVRENILFGREYDAKHYRKVVKVAALDDDLKQFSNGDQTMVDDRGTSLSGGQRARISLARALYTDSDCILLDDPLSAVDASVAKHIFEKCIKGYLKNKCVLLVTHQLQFVKQADQIVVLKNGECIASGSYNHLLSKGIDLFKYSASETTEATDNDNNVPVSPTATFVRPPLVPTSSMNSSIIQPLRFRVDSFSSDIGRFRANSSISQFYESDIDESVTNEHMNILNYNIDQQIDAQLEAASGPHEKSNKSSFKIYMKYFHLGTSFFAMIVFLFSNILAQALFTGTDYWLSEWTNYHENMHIATINPDYHFEPSPLIHSDENINKIIYSSLVLALFVFATVRTVMFFVTCMRASVKLHDKIFSSLIQAPILFFDKTPIGIIMNRVSRDMGIIDDILPPVAFEALEILGSSLAVFILCAILNYFILIPFVVFVIFLILSLKFYVNTARELKRLEATARSPLFNQMASTLAGLPTIRSYGAQQKFIERFSATQDVHTATLFTFLSSSRFFGICLEIMCILYVYFLIGSLLIDMEHYSGSIIGLTISQSLSLTTAFNWGVRQYTEVETYMTSVERVIEFSKLDKEPLETSKQEPSENWPANGDIAFENVSLQYSANADPVLKELTFTIRGGEKIGIVGRTGAGKSSIIATLFRLTEPTGSIRIDGIETSKLSLFRLRKNLAIIPQEPILFSGDIRRNLDPFREKTDEELWNAVEKVQLKTKIQSLPGKLDSPISDSGSDFSVGQKQLICLARAILRQNRILILDEATANVDPRTDSLIQQTIRTEFEHCTVLTIAHRLNTIIDNDRVMVLDNGFLSQFDTPHNLITKESGIFYELFDNLNPEMKLELKQLAKKSNKTSAINYID